MSSVKFNPYIFLTLHLIIGYDTAAAAKLALCPNFWSKSKSYNLYYVN